MSVQRMHPNIYHFSTLEIFIRLLAICFKTIPGFYSICLSKCCPNYFIDFLNIFEDSSHCV